MDIWIDKKKLTYDRKDGILMEMIELCMEDHRLEIFELLYDLGYYNSYLLNNYTPCADFVNFLHFERNDISKDEIDKIINDRLIDTDCECDITNLFEVLIDIYKDTIVEFNISNILVKMIEKNNIPVFKSIYMNDEFDYKKYNIPDPTFNSNILFRTAIRNKHQELYELMVSDEFKNKYGNIDKINLIDYLKTLKSSNSAKKYGKM